MFKSWSEGTDQPAIHFSRKTFIYRKTSILPDIVPGSLIISGNKLVSLLIDKNVPPDHITEDFEFGITIDIET